ncbi:MAG TPA: hypothetical protein VHI72_04195 [Hyphomicrobiaceae bacterium]|jgi:hypothetical protein|nr:hypothetical protein [Hyphomicrobiaceae bacterium]
MFLIDIWLPLEDERGEPFPAECYDRLAQRLTERFGGVTSFTRAPSEDRWKTHGATEREEIVVIEVMAEDREWWSQLRRDLMRDFRQEDIVIRSQAIERLI